MRWLFNMLSLIVCMDSHRNIGKEGELGFRLKEDLNNFKSLTSGNVVVYGRKTLQSMGNKPLPNRTNIIMSRDKNWLHEMEEKYDNVMYAGFKNVVALSLLEDVYICGGSQIYEKFLREHGDCIDEMVVTVVNNTIEGADAKFPSHLVKWNNYEIVKTVKVEEKGKPHYMIYTYQRKNCEIC